MLNKLFVFFSISTCAEETSRWYLKSTSVICFFVLLSITTRLGAVLYPLPKEVTPIDSNPDNASIFKIWGNATSGLNVLSVG